MNYRLFIAINIPDKVKNEINAVIHGVSLEEGGRLISPENWHLTISFLGHQPEEKINLIVEAIKETVANFSSPEINLEKIIYGPVSQPRMIWLTGSEKTSNSLGEIKDKLENKLAEKGIELKRQTRKYDAHITLARFRFPLKDHAGLDKLKNENFSFVSRSIDLMKSVLKRSGAEYEILEKVDFE